MSEMQKPDLSFPRSTGQLISVGIAIYMIIKPVFNFLVLGGDLMMPLLFGIASLIVLFIGIKHSNTVVAIILMLFACGYMRDNLRQIGFNQYLIYTIEGVIDMIAACVLAFNSEINKHCDFLF
ncbi:MAG: hypothetical protein IJ060_01065 [Oscillospiraceae bacterium]|nr:hypothetical protein [Oscillospiraceae bacterium]